MYYSDSQRLDKAFSIIEGYILDGEPPDNLTQFLLEYALEAERGDVLELMRCGDWAIQRAWEQYRKTYDL